MRLDHASDIGRHENNFDVLRLVGALCVLFGHCFVLTGRTEPFPEVGFGWGTTGVLIFFSISGFLVARSWCFDPSVLSYAAKRALRLMPALIVCLLCTALVIGSVATTLPLDTYLEDPSVKAFVLDNTMLQTTYGLPGMFADNAYPAVVNGSLWTLPLEVKAYVLVALLGVVGALRRPKVMLLVALFFAVILFDSIRGHVPGANRGVATLLNIQPNQDLMGQAADGGLLAWQSVFTAFVIAAAMLSARRWILLRWDIAAGLFGLWLLSLLVFGEATSEHRVVLIAPYLVLVIAYRTYQWFHLPRFMGDYSYGIYIYAFPVQQSVAGLLDPGPWAMLIVSVPVTLGLAALSWHLIEKPALALKTRFGGSSEEPGHPLETAR
jgi:peptidoglycan/LPS O-acetylase OafA/YrhL